MALVNNPMLITWWWWCFPSRFAEEVTVLMAGVESSVVAPLLAPRTGVGGGVGVTSPDLAEDDEEAISWWPRITDEGRDLYGILALEVEDDCRGNKGRSLGDDIVLEILLD